MTAAVTAEPSVTYGGYKIHPYAQLFPLIRDSELSGLVDDIKKNGLRDAIVLACVSDDSDEWQIVDGRNRYRACIQAGVSPRFEKNHMAPKDIGEWVLSRNLFRRHLSASQRAAVAVEYVEVFAKEAKKRMLVGTKADPEAEFPQGDRTPQASDAAGDLFEVSGRSVRDAKYVGERDPIIFGQILSGKVTVSAAAKSLRGKAKTPADPKTKADRERSHTEAQLINSVASLFTDERVETYSSTAKGYFIDTLEDALIALSSSLHETGGTNDGFDSNMRLLDGLLHNLTLGVKTKERRSRLIKRLERSLGQLSSKEIPATSATV